MPVVVNTTPPSPSIKKFYLPSTEGKPEDQRAWVDIDVSPETVVDWEAMQDTDSNYSIRQSRVVVGRIKAWNFVNEKNEPLPITYDSFWCLDNRDRLFLLTLDFEKSPTPPLSNTEKKS